MIDTLKTNKFIGTRYDCKSAEQTERDEWKKDDLYLKQKKNDFFFFTEGYMSSYVLFDDNRLSSTKKKAH